MQLEDRMKEYERVHNHRLMKKMPVVLWFDGKAFHTFTKGLNKPFDKNLIQTMQNTAQVLCEEIQGAKIAYTQSDEIAVILTDWEKWTTDAWFDYRVQKLASVGASMATMAFNKIWNQRLSNLLGEHEVEKYKYAKTHRNKVTLFDCRCFNLPNHEVINWLIWRQQDWIRNSVQMFARSKFSQKELNGKNQVQMKDMLESKGKHWEFLEPHLKYGSVVLNKKDSLHYINNEDEIKTKWVVNEPTMIFKNNRDFINKLVDAY